MTLLKKKNSSLLNLKETKTNKYLDKFSLDISNIRYLQLNQRSGGGGSSSIISDTILTTEDSLEFLTEDNRELAIN